MTKLQQWRVVGVIATALVALLALAVIQAKHYVDQQRMVTLGMCPPNIVGPGPGILFYDSREQRLFCAPLPVPSPSNDAHRPPAPNTLEQQPKTGV